MLCYDSSLSSSPRERTQNTQEKRYSPFFTPHLGTNCRKRIYCARGGVQETKKGDKRGAEKEKKKLLGSQKRGLFYFFFCEEMKCMGSIFSFSILKKKSTKPIHPQDMDALLPLSKNNPPKYPGKKPPPPKNQTHSLAPYFLPPKKKFPLPCSHTQIFKFSKNPLTTMNQTTHSHLQSPIHSPIPP